MRDRSVIRNVNLFPAPTSELEQTARVFGSATAQSGPNRCWKDRLAQAIIVICFLAAIPLLAQNGNPPQMPAPQTSSNAAEASDPDRGQKVFDQNCSRCHNAPDGFSSRISGTVARHMRVRANLSDADFKALLSFLNP